MGIGGVFTKVQCV